MDSESLIAAGHVRLSHKRGCWVHLASESRFSDARPRPHPAVIPDRVRALAGPGDSESASAIGLGAGPGPV